MSDLELLEEAVAIAVEAHRGQKDKYGAPYILHPLRVMSRLANPREQIAGILHDVVEDTDWSFEKLSLKGFPSEIIEALKCLTKADGEPYENFVKRSASNELARRVKLADLQDNMDTRRMKQVGDDERKRLQKYLSAWKKLTEGRNK